MTSKAKKFAQDQFSSWSRNQGIEIADQTIKAVSTKVQSKFSSGDLSNIDKISPDVDNFSDKDILDVTEDSITSNNVWLVDKAVSIYGDVKKFVSGDIQKSAFIESMVNHVSGFVSKAVKGVTILAAGVTGAGLSLEYIEGIGYAAGAIASKVFCAIFDPLVKHFRKQEAKKEFEFLHSFYEALIVEMQNQREMFERTTTELFENRQNLIDSCLKKLDDSFNSKDADELSKSLEKIANSFGGELKFKNFAEFDNFMLNSDEELIL